MSKHFKLFTTILIIIINYIIKLEHSTYDRAWLLEELACNSKR